jgi:CRISPR-associated endonuclease/helicase Cas3
MINKNSGYFFWAKKSSRSGVYRWLPLLQHLTDTMGISGLLWEHWLSEGQRDLIIRSMKSNDEETAKRLVQFLGAIHDLGKATPAFQIRQNRYVDSPDLDNQLIEKLEKFGFIDIRKLSLINPEQSPHSIATEALLQSYGVNIGVCSIVGGHHGKPTEHKHRIDIQLTSFDQNFFQSENQDDPIHVKWKNSQREIYMWALKMCGYRNSDDLPTLDRASQIILNGLLIMADWIASNENYFPLFPIDDIGDEIDQKSRLVAGWRKWFKTYRWEPNARVDVQEYYSSRFGFHPRDVQVKMATEITNTAKPGIIILEAPMGIGKTEAALFAVEQLSAKTGRNGVLFCLPTQATSNGMFSRIKEWLSNVAKHNKEPVSLQLVHGKAALNEVFSSMANNIDVDGSSDGSSDGSVIVNEWFSGRKTAVLDDFVVSTIDHFLLSALKQKHLVLRHLGLTKKVIVIDEVHAYDAYMGQYLYRAISWMGHYGVPVIILSATLPMSRRKTLLEAYVRGSGGKVREIEAPKGWETATSYPLLTFLDGRRIHQEKDFSTTSNKEIKVIKIQDQDLIETVSNCLSNGGIIGIVLNTIKRAQQIANELSSHFDSDLIELLHSGFISEHRIKKEQQLLKLIGKNANRPKAKIIVGTQVIEQSLDIDFDVLISDLAPMDLLLQRVGRLHRHNNAIRPQKLMKPILYVLGTDDSFEFESGSSYVYGDYFLIRTQSLLPECINLPRDISTLVQKVYGDFEININQDLQVRYNEAKTTMENFIKNKEARAQSFILEKPWRPSSVNDSLIGWLNNVSPTDSDEKGIAQVRETGDRIEVIVVKKCGYGYSFFNEDNNIMDEIEDYHIGKKLATQSLKLPSILCTVYNIDKTIEALEADNRKFLFRWQQQPWLRGALGIILDENNSYVLNGWKLSYDNKLGLEYVKEGEVEKI